VTALPELAIKSARSMYDTLSLEPRHARGFLSIGWGASLPLRSSNSAACEIEIVFACLDFPLGVFFTESPGAPGAFS
jgi:hypothetical protein